MRRRVCVGKGDNRGNTSGEFLMRAVLGGFSGEDECADLGAATAEDDGICNVRGGAESEFDGNGVGLFAIDLFGFRMVNWGLAGQG